MEGRREGGRRFTNFRDMPGLYGARGYGVLIYIYTHRVGVSIFYRCVYRRDTKRTPGRFWPSALGTSEGRRVTGRAKELEKIRGEGRGGRGVNAKLALQTINLLTVLKSRPRCSEAIENERQREMKEREDGGKGRSGREPKVGPGLKILARNIVTSYFCAREYVHKCIPRFAVVLYGGSSVYMDHDAAYVTA